MHFMKTLPYLLPFFDHRHLWAHLLFSSLLGGDLDFGMEVHVNSFQQITKEDQHRRESRKIFTPQTGQFGATKHTNNSSKQTKKQNMTNTATQLRIGFNTFSLYGAPNLIPMHSTASAWVGKWYSETCKKAELWKQLNWQSWTAFPSKSAAFRRRHNMLNTKWFAQNSFKYSHSIGPWDRTGHRPRRGGIQPCLYSA